MSKGKTQEPEEQVQPATDQAQAPAKPEPEKLTPEQIMAKIGEATTKGDIAEVVRLGNLLKKETKAIEDAENAKLAKEAEELAGAREALAKELHQAIVTSHPQLLVKLAEVKATGFTYKVDAPDKDGVMVKYQSVELAVPKPKAKKSGGGTRASGVSTKDKTGMSLANLIEQYATDEEKQEITDAYNNAEKSPNSAKWSKQKAVEAKILERHPELIVA